MADSGIIHVVTGVPVLLSQYESQGHHALSSGASFPASPVEKQLFYRTNLHRLYIYDGTTWRSVSESYSIDAHASRHQDGGADEISIAALSGEPAALTTHKDATTGVHGAGASHLALFGAASTVVNRVAWNEPPGQALDLSNINATTNWTDLDLTAYTSANAKFAILLLRICCSTVGSGLYTSVSYRPNGSTWNWGTVGDLPNTYNSGAWLGGFPLILALDSGQVMEYKVIIDTGWVLRVWFQVMGYIE